MKKLFLGLLLLSPAGLLSKGPECIDLDCTLLALVDGTEFIDIGEIFSFAKNVLALIHGTNVKTLENIEKVYGVTFPEPIADFADENGKSGMIYFDGGYKTLKEMLIIEQENPEMDLSDQVAHASLHFDKIASDYEEEIQEAKAIMIQIIEDWSILREREDTILLEWASVSDTGREALTQAMTNFEKLDMFTSDLLIFLKDLVRNCPKSYKEYRRELSARKQAQNK